MDYLYLSTFLIKNLIIKINIRMLAFIILVINGKDDEGFKICCY